MGSKDVLTFSPEQFEQLMATVAKNNGGDTGNLGEVIGKELAQAITKLKEPTEEEALELAEKKKRRDLELRARVMLAKTEEDKKRIRRERCNHKKQDGRGAVGGQIMQDGLVHPLCFRCQTEFTPFPPTPEMMTGGVNMMQ